MNVVFGFKEFGFLLTGLKWTVLLSLIAFAGGGIMGLLVAVARTAQSAALRRAMILGNDINLEIRTVWRGQAIPAQTIVPPLTEGYRSDLRTESG